MSQLPVVSQAKQRKDGGSETANKCWFDYLIRVVYAKPNTYYYISN